MTNKTIVLSAGGTGGHLFPAQSLSEELQKRGFVVDLMTDQRTDRFTGSFPAREFYEIPSATLRGRSPVAIAKTLWTLTRGYRQAKSILRRLQPAAIVGFGGYPTLPPLFAAASLGKPCLIHEQNAVMGRANRLLCRRVTAIAKSYVDTRLLRQGLNTMIYLTGNPVRSQVLALRQVPYILPKPGETIQLLVFGGSQGARFFSDSVPAALIGLPEELQARLVVYQQCRPEDVARVQSAYGKTAIKANIAPFFNNLPELMANSQLIIARSGASTVAELCVIGRPALLVPLPHALDNDQLMNATGMEKGGGAWCLEESGLTPEGLTEFFHARLQNGEELAAAAAAAHKLGKPDAVLHLADIVEKLTGSGD
ncbi:MAG: undecaprenyldiphospho-muramoylpentapeptide beta-N-acetylglucosaminyltransferase [Methyloligellaceae bacterium]